MEGPLFNLIKDLGVIVPTAPSSHQMILDKTLEVINPVLLALLENLIALDLFSVSSVEGGATPNGNAHPG